MTEHDPLRPYVAKLLEIAEALADDVRGCDPTADVNVHLEALAEWKRQFDGRDDAAQYDGRIGDASDS